MDNYSRENMRTPEEFELPASIHSQDSGRRQPSVRRRPGDNDDEHAVLIDGGYLGIDRRYTSIDNEHTVLDDGYDVLEEEYEDKDSSDKGHSTVGMELLRQLRRIGQVLLAGRERVGLMCALLVAGKLTAEVVYYYAGVLPSQFYLVLGSRDRAAFAALLARCVGIVVLAGTCRAGLDYAAGLLGVAMRRTLTAYTQARYLRRGSFYSVASSGLDTVDMRITQDIERLATSAAEVTAELLIAPAMIAYYTARCWAMSGVFGPMAIYVYFIVGAIASRWAMAPIVPRVCALEQAEGDFRVQHVRAGECAEAIAFYGGETVERKRANAALTRVVRAQRSVLWRQLSLGMLTQVFSYLGSTVSYVVIGIPIFLGVYDDKTGAELSSIISLNAFVSIYLIYRFSTVIEQTKRLADLGGYAARVVQLWEALDAADADTESQTAITADSTNGAIEAVNLTVAAPARPALVSRLSIEVHPGEPLMITGPNGSGKTSLLRTLCGLWRPRSGAVRLPQHDGAPDVFFVPQMAYVAAGSLREQLSYPGRWGGRHRLCSDAELARLVDAVGLAHVAARAGDPDRRHSDRQWQRLLSPGEQQKVAIARVLFWRPAFAALDESTSALNNAAEAALYRALAAAGITAVSVSHHDNLAAFHTQRLALDGCGGFELTSI